MQHLNALYAEINIHLDEPNDKRCKAWNAEELRTFLALIEGHPLEPAFVLAANTVHVLPAMDEQAVATFVQHVYRDPAVH